MIRMKTEARIQFKKWLDDRGIKMSFAARKMDISYSHLVNWIAGRDGLSADIGFKIEAFTDGAIKMIDCLFPRWKSIHLFVWGGERLTWSELKKRASQKR